MNMNPKITVLISVVLIASTANLGISKFFSLNYHIILSIRTVEKLYVTLSFELPNLRIFWKPSVFAYSALSNFTSFFVGGKVLTNFFSIIFDIFMIHEMNLDFLKYNLRTLLAKVWKIFWNTFHRYSGVMRIN